MSDDCVDLMIAAFASLVTDYNQGGDFALYTLEDKDGDEDDLTVTNENSYFDQVWSLRVFFPVHFFCHRDFVSF